MRVIAAIFKWFLIFAFLCMMGALAWLYFAPPALIGVGTGYAAKIVCSNRFIAGRDPSEVMRIDVQAPGHPLLTLLNINVDEEAGRVSSALLGIFGRSHAQWREGLGCTSVPDRDFEAARRFTQPDVETREREGLWPAGDEVPSSANALVDAILDDPAMRGPAMRAVVVVHRGRIVGERYGEDFSAETPLLGWSMTKTVTAALIGTLVHDGRLSLDQTQLLREWDDDGRRDIAIADLLAMSSGLAFNENYGDVTDVTQMLYLEPNMPAYAASRPLVAGIGDRFSYSSGTSVVLSRIWQNLFEDPMDALAWPRRALFAPLGMDSAIMEADARGTFVGSSYLYATARDWARFGQFLLQEGEWEGRRLLPDGYVDWMRRPTPASNGEYGQGHVWLHGPMASTPEGENADFGYELPGDAYWLLGHDGQSMVIVPSLELVVLRMGLTPASMGYKPQGMVEALVDALR